MKWLLILLISISTIVFSTAAFPFTFYVNPGDRIQEAIDIAIDGDTIIVRDGTYTGDGNRDIDLRGKAITLISENGPEVTIIDCQGTEEDPHRGFCFDSGEGPNSVIDGFTITNGFRSYGGGIFCEFSSPTITNCTISSNSADRGGGISYRDSSPMINNCTISDNSVYYYGGGIYCSHYSNSTINNCTISGNTTGDYGGGICCASSSLTISNSTITDNTADYEGGGIYCYDGNATIADCTISGNWAYWSMGGGIYCELSSPTISHCMISHNTTEWGAGGGIYCELGSPTIANCTISGNLAVDWNGGGICCRYDSSPTITDCTISGNEAGEYGGGIYCYVRCSPIMTDCIVWSNTAPTGDEIALTSAHTSTLMVRHCDVQGGAAEAYVESGCTLDLDGTNIDSDPMFVKGPLHDYYLSQVASGQDADSPCVDAGSDTAENLGLDKLSTRTDGMPDTGRVDMGYHAPYALWIHSITRGSDDVTLHWNALPGVSYTVQLSTDLERWMSIPAGQTDTWTDTNASGYRKKFYRVLEQ